MFKAGTVVATASAAKADAVKSFGADEIVDYRSSKFEEVLEAGTFDAVLDCTGEGESTRNERRLFALDVALLTPRFGDIFVRDVALLTSSSLRSLLLQRGGLLTCSRKGGACAAFRPGLPSTL